MHVVLAVTLIKVSLDVSHVYTCAKYTSFVRFSDSGSSVGAQARQHALAQDENKTCIYCHKGIAPQLSEEFMEIEYDKYLEEDTGCSQCHADM
jgi:hypothetical protein